ncbi:MAG: bifunctional 4-hydroxy-2-oxoglutarate aldolase/2-dehydro-3-deoxy-phosphogluconate aldolase [Elusimicrobia bacterium]|nr:bifunctional 4-hydroxy-2-oxoglutarate aldolase/2-dehydro-3-deoxy-phosphogluconate aldolase [Elusimicrobiota bacterium]
MMDLREFEKLPLMGILRGIEESDIEPLAEAVISAGLKTIEIAMNTANAPQLIEKLKKISGGRLCVGAGTVLTEDILTQALSAGAEFIVLPTLVPDVVARCVEEKIPVFPGGLTPREIYDAWQAGASMVKVFPAKFFGPSYFREIKAPFRDIKLLACGGVTAGNIKNYFSSGASAVAFGGGIFKRDLIKKRDFISIENSIRKLISAFRGNYY